MIQGDILHISLAANYKGFARYDSVKMTWFMKKMCLIIQAL